MLPFDNVSFTMTCQAAIGYHVGDTCIELTGSDHHPSPLLIIHRLRNRINHSIGVLFIGYVQVLDNCDYRNKLPFLRVRHSIYLNTVG